MTQRVTMWCDVCRGSDTDPRHHIAMPDGTVQTRHMDCCRDAGCHDNSCDKILEASGELRKQELLSWIEKGGVLLNFKPSAKPVILREE